MKVEKVHLIRDFNLVNIPKGPKGQPIDVRFTVDRDGILTVKAVDEDNRPIAILENNKFSKKGKKAKPVLEQELDKKVSKMEKEEEKK